jgi:hypothetical protein
VFLTLTQDVHRASGGAKHIASDDAMRQLHMMKAKELNALVEVQQPLCDFMQWQEVGTPPIELFNGNAGVVELIQEGLSQPRRKMKKGKKTG